MTHPNQASIDAMTSALLLDHMADHLDGPADFARRLAEYVSLSQEHAPDPEHVAAGTRLFLALRLAWNDEPRDIAAPAETMAAVQDSMRALGYELDLDGVHFDMHTPEARGSLSEMPEHMRDQLEASGFVDDADMGLLDAALWFALAHHVVGNRFEEEDPVQIVNVHRRLRVNLVTRIYTGSFDLATDDLVHLVAEARALVIDMASAPTPGEMLERSMMAREAFGVEEEAEAFDMNAMQADSTPPLIDIDDETMHHASSTLAAVSDGDTRMAWAMLVTMMMGSETGMPAAPNMASIYRLVRDTDEMLVPTADAGASEDLLDAVATMAVAMVMTGRLEPMDKERTGILVNLAARAIARDLDPFEEEVAVIIETVTEALGTLQYEIDDYMAYAAAGEADGDALVVRSSMDKADPSPPPASGAMVMPTAVLVEMDDKAEIHIGTLRTHLQDSFTLQEDSFSAFAQGDVYWRLSTEDKDVYAAIGAALKTIAAVPGVKRVSVTHRGETGLGVTSLSQGGRPLHRIIEGRMTED